MRSQHLKRMCTGEMRQEAQPSSQLFSWAAQEAFQLWPSPHCDISLKDTKWGLHLHPSWEHPEDTALCQ